MRSRIGVVGGGRSANAPYIGTFHSLGARILRQECRVFHREPNFAIFDDHDSSDLIKKAIKEAFPNNAKQKGRDKKAPAVFARKISEMKNIDARREIEKNANEDRAEEKREINIIYNAYEAALQRNNAFDFDDLIEKPVALFKAHPEILRRHQNRFDAILVDEYQDINPKQYEFVKLLAGGHRNLTVVGDDEQTIYTWRYADIKIFLDFDKDWKDAIVCFLEENYRSTGNIINGASAVVQKNRFRTPKKLWTSQEAGEPITLYEAWGENDEAAWIGGKITDLRHAGVHSAIAILYRTNAQSRAIEQALIRESVPYKIFGGLKFYERREIKDVVSALRYAGNAKDELSRERLEKNLTKRKFAEFKTAITSITGLADAEPKPTDIIKLFLKVFGYFDYLQDNFINADERQENIAELINFASGFDSLPDLLERLSLLQATDDENAAAKSEGGSAAEAGTIKAPPVHLSTIHMAKGLEFDVVFLAGAAEGLLPHIRSIDNDASLEEERRLMYVAMTRARKLLFISFYGLPSRFVSEIPEEYTTLTGDTEVSDTPKRKTFDPYSKDDDFYVEENIVDF